MIYNTLSRNIKFYATSSNPLRAQMFIFSLVNNILTLPDAVFVDPKIRNKGEFFLKENLPQNSYIWLPHARYISSVPSASASMGSRLL